VAPSKKVTMPVGTPDPGLLTTTVAVSMTDWPKTEEARDEATEVVVAAARTDWVSAVDVLAVKLVSPAKTAVIERSPTGSEVTVSDAIPAESSVALPRGTAPSKKVTIPVGVPAPGACGATVAVKVTDCPNTGEAADETTEVVVAAALTVCVSTEDVLVS
jgi:hypothetical protein